METPSKPTHTQHELMHEEIKWRAYHFLEQKQTGTSGINLNDELKDELPRIAYALSLVRSVAMQTGATTELTEQPGFIFVLSARS